MKETNNPRQRYYVSCFDLVFSMNEANFRALCAEQISQGWADLSNYGKCLSDATSRRLLTSWTERVVNATDGFDAKAELEWLDMEPVYRLGE